MPDAFDSRAGRTYYCGSCEDLARRAESLQITIDRLLTRTRRAEGTQHGWKQRAEKAEAIITRIHAWIHSPAEENRFTDLATLLAEGGSGCERCAPKGENNWTSIPR